MKYDIQVIFTNGNFLCFGIPQASDARYARIEFLKACHRYLDVKVLGEAECVQLMGDGEVLSQKNVDRSYGYLLRG